MPKIDVALNKPNKFTKVDYRPWDNNLLESLKINPLASLNDSIDNNKITNRKQIDNKTTINTPPPANQDPTHEITNRKQIDNKRVTAALAHAAYASEQITNGQQIDNKWTTKQTTEQITNGQQIDNKPIEKPHPNQLGGNEREIFYFLFSKCRLLGSQTTPPICLEILKELRLKSTNVVKTSLYRLVKKGFLIRKAGKKGRAGWVMFQIPFGLYQQLIVELDGEWITNRKQIDNNKGSKQITEQVTSPSSSSNNIYINKTTTKESDYLENLENPISSNINQQNIFGLPDEWMQINTTALKNLSHSHLKQLYQKNQLTAEQVQESIDAFAFDLEKNNKKALIHGDEVNFLMGILLKRGMPYTPPDNYESPRDRAMRIYLEKKREQQQKRKQMQRQLMGLEFEEWYSNLTTEQKKEIIPSYKEETKFSKNLALGYFEENVFPEIEQSITSNTLKDTKELAIIAENKKDEIPFE